MIPEMTELTDTPVKKNRTETKTGVVTRVEASPGRRRMMAMVRQSSVNLSPYKGTKSQSFSSLHSVTKSPSQLSARRLVRKYHSTLAKVMPSRQQRQEIASLRQSLPNLAPASSDLDLVLEAITYIRQLQDKLVTMADTKSASTSINISTNLSLKSSPQ